MFNFKVNESKLRQIAVALRNMPSAVRLDAAQRLVPRYQALLQLNFSRSSGPDGKRWPPPKARPYQTPMVRTGAGKAGYVCTVVQSGQGFSIYVANRKDYMAMLNKGTATAARRLQTPEANAPWPTEYLDAHRLSYEEAVKAYWARQPK